jgi:hypothetical protein
MAETPNEAPRQGGAERGSSRRDDPLTELTQLLLENPWLKQALALALDARERASVAGAHAIRGLNIPTASDTDRLERRLRAVSERLEAVEDALDQLSRELAELRRSGRA